MRFHVVAGEFSRYATPGFGPIMGEARRLGLDMTVANQAMDQFGEDDKATLATNFGNRIAFTQHGPSDAKWLATLMPPMTPRDLTELPRHSVAAKLMASGDRGAGTVVLATIPVA